MRAVVKLKTEPTGYDGFNLVEFIEKTRRANNEARHKEVELPYRGLYVPEVYQLPEDELQLIVYMYLFWKMFGLKIRFSLLIYVNRNKPEERKPALVEYDENVMEKFLDQLDLQHKLLKKKSLIEPYLPVESYIHLRCPYRLKCPRGQEAIRTEVKKKSVPLWKIYQLRRQKQKLAPLEPEQRRLF